MTLRVKEREMERIILRAQIFCEGDVYVALCPHLNVSSFGEDIAGARRALQEAVEAFVETCEEMGTLEEVLEEAGFRREGDSWVLREPVAEEVFAVTR